jgi:hypothetical protein
MTNCLASQYIELKKRRGPARHRSIKKRNIIRYSNCSGKRKVRNYPQLEKIYIEKCLIIETRS